MLLLCSTSTLLLYQRIIVAQRSSLQNYVSQQIENLDFSYWVLGLFDFAATIIMYASTGVMWWFNPLTCCLSLLVPTHLCFACSLSLLACLLFLACPVTHVAGCWLGGYLAGWLLACLGCWLRCACRCACCFVACLSDARATELCLLLC